MMIGPDVKTLPLFSPFFSPLILLLASGVGYGGMLSSGLKRYPSDASSTNTFSPVFSLCNAVLLNNDLFMVQQVVMF